MNAALRHALALAGLWLFLVLVALFSRSFMPIDETRYVTVAWDMWQRGDFLVPYLNGEPYSHKPPLLFWLMHLGWAVFGVNEWWPRLVPSLFALAALGLTAALARRLWPDRLELARLAPLVLLGCALWTVFTTATMFDMLVAFFTLLGVLGIVTAWQGAALRGWLLLGLAIGGGLLAKGPTILLQLLPLAVLAPWWGRAAPQPWGRWYGGILGALLLGAAIALLWAVPAGLRGGDEYRHAIFWGQTAHRMVNSFAHQRGFFWYFPLLPAMLFPWLLWPTLWRGAARLRGLLHETGVRLALAWLLPVFLAFCFISGKQVHYLLPIFPAFALLAGRLMLHAGVPRRWDWLPVAGAGVAFGVLLLVLPEYAHSHQRIAAWVQDIPAWGGAVLVVGSLGLVCLGCADIERTAWRLTLYSALSVVVLSIAVVHQAARSAYDVHPISQRLKVLEDAGVPLAHASKYHGTFNFVGRLRRSPERTHRYDLSEWFARHPEGRAIIYFTRKYPMDGAQTEFLQRFEGDLIAIVNRAQWEAWWAAHQAGEAGDRAESGAED